VSYIDKTTGREHHVRARIVVVAASACESARLLLNSKSSQFPQGLANSSGVVGQAI
jgi:choline dehydrogenase-like flavoprotein